MGVRRDLEAALGPAPSSCRQFARPIPVGVIGIGFFNTSGGHPTGHPPNGFELHPVLDLELNRGQALTAAERQSHACTL
jgi:hypothetical protein